MRKNKKNITISKKLLLSNILVVTIPLAIITILIIMGFVFTWFIVNYGGGIQFIDSQDFYKISGRLSQEIEKSLQQDMHTNPIDDIDLNIISDKYQLYILVTDNNDIVYEYGIKTDIDDTFIEYIESLGGTGFISNSQRELYMKNCVIDNEVFTISLILTISELSYKKINQLIGFIALILILITAISIYIVNKFLNKIITKNIVDPLSIFLESTNNIKQGQFENEIVYPYQDEFTPVFENFNAMSKILKNSEDIVALHEQNRKELLVSISHDLRSPLSSIKAYVEGLLDGVASNQETKDKYLKMIKSKSDDIDQMISKISLFSKLEMGDYVENLEVVQLDILVKDYIKLIKDEYADKNLQIKLGHISKSIVYADSYHIKSILNNIIENSLKYKSKEIVTVVISLEKENNTCFLTLKDDGTGVNESELKHLFEVFYRCDRSRHNPDKGSGIGLAIVKNAVLRMNGKVFATNAETGGLEITIRLPIYNKKGVSDE